MDWLARLRGWWGTYLSALNWRELGQLKTLRRLLKWENDNGDDYLLELYYDDMDDRDMDDYSFDDIDYPFYDAQEY